MKLIQWQESRLEELVSLWNKEIGKEFPMRTPLFKQNSFDDENICLKSSAIAVDDQNKVVGFVIAKRWQEELDLPMNDKLGWIQAMIVDRGKRNEEIGTKLLTHAESALKEQGLSQISLGKDPWHYFPGIPSEYNDVCEWFEEKGYKKQGTVYDMICSYEADDEVSLPERDGVQFTLLHESEKDDLLNFLRKCFPGRWEYEAIHYFQKDGTGREFVVAKKSGKIIGFCRINDANSPLIAQNVYWQPLFDEELGGIGPLGIDSEERGQGYGLAIVEAGIAFLRKRGVNRIVIDWTGLVDFYAKLGYEKWKGYESYGKDL